MKRNRKRSLGAKLAAVLYALMVLCLAFPVQAQIRAGVSYLKVIPGTRHLGMAGSITAMLDHHAALYANPGATGFLREWQWSATYTQWVPDIYDASLLLNSRLSLPWSRWSRLALGVSYLGIKEFDSTNGRLPAVDGSEVLAIGSLGQPLTFLSPWLSFGVTGKYFRSRLAGFNATALAFDAGLLYRTPRFRLFHTGLGLFDEAILAIGASVTHLGKAIRFSTAETPLPQTWRAGISVNTGSHRGLQMQISADYRQARDEDPFTAVGAEISWRHILFFRAGYQFEDQNVLEHVSMGMSFGLDDVQAGIPGANHGIRVDFAKDEGNRFFTTPSRGSFNHFPIHPERFSFIAPKPEAIVEENQVTLLWEATRDPDLFDTVGYLVLVDQRRAAIEQVIQRLRDEGRYGMQRLVTRPQTELGSLQKYALVTSPALPLFELGCGDYFWSVVAYDKDHHYRVISRHGENIARFSVASPDLTVQEIAPVIATDGADKCRQRADIVIANTGTASADRLVLRLFRGAELVQTLESPAVLRPQKRFVFENVMIGEACDTRPLLAWINRDLDVPECDTTNNRLSIDIRRQGGFDLQVTKTASRASISPGESVDYKLVVTNNGCCEVNNVEVIDTPPISVQTSHFRRPFPVDSTGSRQLVWRLETLPAHASVTLQYRATIKPFRVQINFQNDRYRWNADEVMDFRRARQSIRELAARLVDMLRSHEPLRLNIVGYTSSPGRAAYNETLSRNRAATLRDQLVRALFALDPNLDTSRITSEGRGERIEYRVFVDDMVDTVDRNGRVLVSRHEKQAGNRRVEIEFINLPPIRNQVQVKAEGTEIDVTNNRASATVHVESQIRRARK